MVDFGNKLKALRLNAGLTQKQLAEQMKVTKSVISYYELQERYPSPESLIKLATIFSVSTDYLLGIDKKEMLDVSNLSDTQVDTVRRVIAEFNKINK